MGLGGTGSPGFTAFAGGVSFILEDLSLPLGGVVESPLLQFVFGPAEGDPSLLKMSLQQLWLLELTGSDT